MPNPWCSNISRWQQPTYSIRGSKMKYLKYARILTYWFPMTLIVASYKYDNTGMAFAAVLSLIAIFIWDFYHKLMETTKNPEVVKLTEQLNELNGQIKSGNEEIEKLKSDMSSIQLANGFKRLK